MAVRLLYPIVRQVMAWLGLLARSAPSKNAEILSAASRGGRVAPARCAAVWMGTATAPALEATTGPRLDLAFTWQIAEYGHDHRVCGVRDELRDNHLWVPNWSSTSCDLGIFVDQSAEPIAASDAKWER